MQYFTNLKEAEAALAPFLPSNLKRHAYTLEHVSHFLEYVGDPQNGPRAIHVAGTSGKTSTAHYAASLLTQTGKRVGLLVSPHAEHLNERVQINMKPLDARIFCDELSIFLEAVKKSGMTLTYAEILYAFAYWEFARQHVEYIVVEVGMGGLLDATNVIDRQDKICIITDIGMDHTNVLGNTLAEIASQKAGIIRLHNSVFCYEQTEQIMGAILTACRQQQADLYTLENKTVPGTQFLPMFQRRNFALAFEATMLLFKQAGLKPLTQEQLMQAVRTHVPGRMEIIRVSKNEALVLDGAHNPQKLEALRTSMQDYFPGEEVAALVAFTGGRGRDIDELAAQVAQLAKRVIVTSIVPTKGKQLAYIDPVDVAAACKKAGVAHVEVIADQKQAYLAFLRCSERILLVTGSLYLVGQVRPLVTGSEARPLLLREQQMYASHTF